jgi:translocation and assembly module TamB
VKRRRVLIIAAVVLLLVLSIPAAALCWIGYTESGLRWLVARAENLRAVQITFTGLDGRLSGPITIQRFELRHERAHIVATDVRTELDLGAVLLQTVELDYLRVSSIELALKPRTKPPVKRAPRFLPRWLRLHVGDIEIERARLVMIKGTKLDVAPFRTELTLTSSRLALEDALVESGPYRLAGALDVLATDPVGLGGDLEWLVRLPEQPQYAGRVKVDGDLDELRIEGAVSRPFALTLAGTAFTLTRDWRWQARTRAEAFDLKPWQPQSKLGTFSSVLEGEGNREGLTLSGVMTPSALPTGPIALTFQGGFVGREVRADTLTLKLPERGAEFRTQGRIAFDGGPPTIHLTGHWKDLRLPLKAPKVTSRSGTLTLDGPMPYAFSMTGDVVAPRGIDASVKAAGELDRETLTLHSLTAQTLGGSLQGNGSVSWAGDKPWQARIDARNLNAAVAHPELAGRVSFRLTGNGRGFDARGSWRADLAALSGTIRGQPVSGRASLQREKTQFRVRDTDLRFGSAQLVASGVYGSERDLHVELHAADLSHVLPEARGQIELTGDLEGTEQKPELALSLQMQDFEFRQVNRRYAVARVEADADVDLSDRDPSWLRFTASDLSVDERTLRTLRLTVEGHASAHTLTVRADAGNAQLELMTRAGYVREEWSGELQRLDLAIGGDTRFALESPTRFLASRKRAELGAFCLTSDRRRACGEGRWELDGPWNVQARANDLPLRLLAAGLPRPSEYSGLLALELNAGAERGRPWTGTGRVDFTDGMFSYRRASGKIERIEIGTGRAQAAATPEALTASVDLKATDVATLDADARAQRRADGEWRKFPLSGSLRAETRNLGFLPVLVPEVDRASGQLKANLEMSGTLGAPRLDGRLTLEQGEIDLYAINLLLRDVGVTLDLVGNGLKLDAHLRAGKGTAAINGELAWTEGKPRGALKFSGENLELVNVPEARVLASPNLRFRLDGRRIDVDGAVRVPTARLAPANLTGAKLPSADEVIVGTQPTPPEKRFHVTTGVHMILGDDVHVDSYGLSGEVKGGVLTYSATGEVSTGIGEIEIEEGKYVAYTRELDIERGRLVFSGGPLSNPGVDIRAVKQLPDVLTGVHVRGTLRSPQLTFFSEPPLTQSQIFAILVTGRTLDSIQDEGSAGVSRESMLAQGGAFLAGRLGEQMGLEDLTVESQQNEANEASLVLGTYLSPNLYVSYGISLAESINTFKLKYTLGDHWTIKTEAGENQSADLVYTIEPK